MAKAFSLNLSSHIYFDSSVSFSYRIRLKDFLWLRYLSLNEFAVMPMYSFFKPSSRDVTTALSQLGICYLGDIHPDFYSYMMLQVL